MSDNLAELSKSLAEDLHTESMWDWELLPPEILIQSLSLLPIKTLITCTSVSKTWKSIIQNPTFISNHLHLSNNNNNNNNLFLFRLYSKELLKATRNFEIDEDGTELYKLYWDNNNKEDFNEHTSFDFPFHGESFSGVFDVIGTYNGLFCLTDTACFALPMMYFRTPTVSSFGTLALESSSNFLHPMCLAKHTVCALNLLVLDLMPKPMTIRW
jgi:hypothetical protein